MATNYTLATIGMCSAGSEGIRLHWGQEARVRSQLSKQAAW